MLQLHKRADLIRDSCWDATALAIPAYVTEELSTVAPANGLPLIDTTHDWKLQ